MALAENEAYPKQLETIIKEAKKSSNFIRIKYGDRNGNVTLRTIQKFKIHRSDEVTYLVGYCMLRNADRNFNFGRIQFLEVLNLEQPISK